MPPAPPITSSPSNREAVAVRPRGFHRKNAGASASLPASTTAGARRSRKQPAPPPLIGRRVTPMTSDADDDVRGVDSVARQPDAVTYREQRAGSHRQGSHTFPGRVWFAKLTSDERWWLIAIQWKNSQASSLKRCIHYVYIRTVCDTCHIM